MARLGFAVHVIEAVLNHTGGEISGVTAVYNRHKYLAEKRRALDTWAAYVMGLVNAPAASNVVALRGADMNLRSKRSGKDFLNGRELRASRLPAADPLERVRIISSLVPESAHRDQGRP